MRLMSLRIAGFKSFVNDTHVPIEKGTTVIVGPNGCGKSNIVEAIRWVMGEGSAKKMRADEMDDVIFNGAAQRARRDFAEVNLLLDNSDGRAPAPYQNQAQLQVSRRIDRAKGSFYTINGNETRAKDVRFLFADQGSGASSSAMVGQGKITALLEGKPTEKRIILEEAAGIRGLQSRKHEAQLKLQATENNLHALKTVLDEKKILNKALLKQAQEAQKYRTLSNEIDTKTRLIAAIQWYNLTHKITELENQTQEILKQLTQKQNTSSQCLIKITEIEEKIEPLKIKTTQVTALFNQAQLELNRREDEEKRLKTQLQEWQTRLKQANTDTQHAKNSTEEAIHKHKSSQEKLTNIDKEQHIKQEKLKTLLPELLSKQKKQKEITDTAQAIHDKLRLKQEKINYQQNHLQELNLQQEAIQEKITTTETHLQNLKNAPTKENGEVSPENQEEYLKNLEKQIAESAEQQSKISNLLQELRKKPEIHHNKRSEAVALIEAKLNPLRLKCEALEAEAQALQKRLDDDGITDEAVINHLQPHKGYETAIASILGEAAFASLSNTSEAYWQELEALGNNSIGNLVVAKDVVKAPNELSRCFQHSFIAEDFSTALSYLSDLRMGQIIVSLDGGLCRWDGYVRSPNKANSLAQNLQHKARLQELETLLPIKRQEIASIQAENLLILDGLSNESDSIQAAIIDKETKLAQSIELVNSLYDKRQKHQSEFASMLEQKRELENRIHLGNERLQDFLSERADIQKRVDGVLGELNNDKEQHEHHKGEQGSILAALESENEEISGSLKDLQEAYSVLQGEVNYFDSRKQILENDCEEWQARSKREEARLQECLNRVRDSESRILEFENRPNILREERDYWLGQISSREILVKEVSESLSLLESESVDLEHEKQSLSTDLKRLQDLLDADNEQLLLFREQLIKIESEIGDLFLLSATELIDSVGESDISLQASHLNKLQLDLERLKGHREALGVVNLQAERESEALSIDISQTESDSADLEEAVRKLRLAINRLNSRARERLEEAFKSVEENFSLLFSRLFGGGSATLNWVEEEDILLAGLEIKVTPPGKRTQLLSLLSGGEQTLTALALLFSVFISRPALICVLDEVDALLDDNNVSRFCDLLDYLQHEVGAQFLVVSHHRLTMARADRLYGVTMAERGVSSLVSVNMETAENYMPEA